MTRFEFFDHVADVGIRVSAATLPDLYRTAGRALMEWIGPPPLGTETLHETLHLEGENQEDLLVRWLQELLYLFHARHAYLTEVRSMEVEEPRLRAEIRLCRWTEAERSSFREVKAVTYHQLGVWRAGEAWEASVILDV